MLGGGTASTLAEAVGFLGEQGATDTGILPFVSPRVMSQEQTVPAD